MSELLEIFEEASKEYVKTLKDELDKLKETDELSEVIMITKDNSRSELILIINELLDQLSEVEVENQHYAKKLKQEEEELEII